MHGVRISRIRFKGHPISMVRIVAQLGKYLQDPLYKNSLFLMARAAATALLGIVFWIFVARFYPADQVGLATALISATGLVGIFTGLGLGLSLIRYLPQESDKKGVINTALTIRGLFSIVLSVIFVAGLGFWSPALLFVQKDIALLLLFIMFTTTNSLLMLQSSAFIGMRSVKLSFFESLITGVFKIPLPIVLVSLGVLGIYSSWGLATFVGLMAGLFLFLPRVVSGYRPVPTIRRKLIRETAGFSMSNYVVGILDSLPGLLIPLMIVNILAPEMSAYFYMAWAIANMLFMISTSTTASLFAEGSYDPSRFRKDVIRAVKFAFILLIPAILGILILGDKLLLLFGSEYSENASKLLWLLALSGIPLTITRIYVAIKRIQLKIRPLIVIYAFRMIGILALSYVLMTSIGLLGIGIAWISVQGITAVVIGLLIMKKEKWVLMGGSNRRHSR